MTRYATSAVLGALVLASATTLPACGDDDGDVPGVDAGFDAAGMDAAAIDAGPAPPDAHYPDAWFTRADLSTMCGTAVCGPDQICLFHCCAAPCDELAAGTTCMGTSCTTATGAAGCRAACRPAPPECVVVQRECMPTVSCECLPPTACGEGTCGRFAMDGLHCVCR